jgi:hypothetical protein
LVNSKLLSKIRMPTLRPFTIKRVKGLD